MNYIAEIKRFYDRQLSEHLSAGQIALWHALIEISNRNGWQEWFTAPIETLVLMSGQARQSVYRSLQKLQQAGYISVDKKRYKLVTNPDTNPDPHLIYNKTKLNETKLNERKDGLENGKAKLRGEDSIAIPGGVKL